MKVTQDCEVILDFLSSKVIEICPWMVLPECPIHSAVPPRATTNPVYAQVTRGSRTGGPRGPLLVSEQVVAQALVLLLEGNLKYLESTLSQDSGPSRCGML